MPRSRQVHIFATRNDLIPGAQNFERELPIKYVRSDGLRQVNDFEEYVSLGDCAEIGRNVTGSHISGCRLLALPKDRRIRVERVRQEGGSVLYALDQSKNPDSVSFLPGGIYDEKEVLICGHIGTASESQVSIELYKAFVRAVTKGFEKIGAYRVGPEAVRLMDEGYRMVTIGIGSPREYDLRRE